MHCVLGVFVVRCTHHGEYPGIWEKSSGNAGLATARGMMVDRWRPPEVALPVALGSTQFCFDVDLWQHDLKHHCMQFEAIACSHQIKKHVLESVRFQTSPKKGTCFPITCADARTCMSVLVVKNHLSTLGIVGPTLLTLHSHSADSHWRRSNA